MELLFEILKTILPAIIAGFSTFLITKYTYNKNIPLDKLEISYNRIYYPLYKLICNENNKDNIDLIITETKLRFKKYQKYVDISTLRIFNSLCNSKTISKKKADYQIFIDNIYNRNAYLRRRLGYLEPNLLQLYRYSSSSEKSTFRMVLEFGITYIFMFLGSIFADNLQIIILSLSIVSGLCFIVEAIVKFIMFLYYRLYK